MNIGTSVPDYTTSIQEYSCLHSYRLENLNVNRRSSRVRSEETITQEYTTQNDGKLFRDEVRDRLESSGVSQFIFW